MGRIGDGWKRRGRSWEAVEGKMRGEGGVSNAYAL